MNLKQLNKDLEKMLVSDYRDKLKSEQFDKFEPYDRESDPRVQGTSTTPPQLPALSDYIRMQLREDGFARRLFPPLPVTPADLDKEQP